MSRTEACLCPPLDNMRHRREDESTYLGYVAHRPAPDLNVPALRKTLEWVEAEAARGEESAWRQESYATRTACGTAFCAAGYVAAELVGARPHFDAVADPDGELVTDVCVLPDGEFASIDSVAREELGLTSRESMRLFDGTNSLEDVRRIVGRLLETAGDRP